jgi:hypothetical protein
VAQQLVARMTPEQQAMVAQLPEREQLRVLSNFYERLFIPPRAPPWQPSSAVLAALMQQRREHSAADAKGTLHAQQSLQPGVAGRAARLLGQAVLPGGQPRAAQDIAALTRAAVAAAGGAASEASAEELSQLQVSLLRLHPGLGVFGSLELANCDSHACRPGQGQALLPAQRVYKSTSSWLRPCSPA